MAARQPGFLSVDKWNPTPADQQGGMELEEE